MHTISVPRFDDMALASGRSASELEHELRVLLAIKLFELQRVSMGVAADVAGMSKQGFMDELARFKVPAINYTAADLAGEADDP
jgi:predicted HTH domain antitoxin